MEAAGVLVIPSELLELGGEPPGTADCICLAKSISPETSASTMVFFSSRSLMLRRRTEFGLGLEGGPGGAGGVPVEPFDSVTVKLMLLTYFNGVGCVESVTVMRRGSALLRP